MAALSRCLRVVSKWFELFKIPAEEASPLPLFLWNTVFVVMDCRSLVDTGSEWSYLYEQ